MVPEISRTTDRIFCHFGQFFAHLPSKKLKNQNFEKNRKKYLEILSFYTSVPKIRIIGYTVTDIWHVPDVIVIFHFRLFFALLPPWQPEKWKFHNNEKNTWRCHRFTPVYWKLFSYGILLLRYDAWEMQLLFFILGYFCPFTPLTAQKIKILKKWRKHMRYHHFTHVYHKLWLDDVLFLRNGVQRMDGWTDRKSDT